MPGELTSLLKQAVALQQQGQYSAAQALYRQVLAIDPLQFDALHLLGVAERQRGHPEAALELIGAALALQPDSASARCNLGAALQDLGRHQEALDSFVHALTIQPDYPMGLYNQANALRHLGRIDEALASYDRALALKPDYPEALCNRALALLALQRADLALQSCEQALRLRARFADAWNVRGTALLALGDPEAALDSFGEALHSDLRHGEAWRQRAAVLLRFGEFEEAIDSAEHACACRPGDSGATLGRANVLRAMGRQAEAADTYRQAGAEGADPALVDYMLALLGEAPMPTAPPPSYIAALFDQYAGHFDQHLQGKLAYRTPVLLEAAVGPAHDLHVIDLGCGTGLCGPWLRRLAHTLEGVDLSPAMLEAARSGGCYDKLACAELVAYLEGLHTTVDLLVAADVLVYLGDLGPAFRAASARLASGGRLAFSVEEGSAEIALGASGRYAHSECYVRRLAAQHWMDVVHLGRGALREDGGTPVQGLLVVLRRQA
jgi:predicted TPR repeat methyltransferase